jgi:replicative DNA helicase Mcm
VSLKRGIGMNGEGFGYEEAKGGFQKPEETEIAQTPLKGAANPFIPKFEEFFSTLEYKKKIEKLAHEYPQKKSLIVDYNDLDSFDYQLAEELLTHPDLLIEAAEYAVQKIEVPVLQLDKFSPNVRFRGLPADKAPLIRDISAVQLGKLFALEGVIRQVTEVMPKLKSATWRCKRCGNQYILEQDGHQQRKPAFCNCKHRDFELVPEESTFVDYQKIQIQEPLEMLKGSEQAVNLDVYIEDDFVNRVYPGNRTQITGILRLYPPNKDKKNVYGRYLEAIHLEETEKEFEDVTINEDDEAKIKEIAKNPKIYDILIQSIAPTIHGHDIAKESISLQLFGGVKKTLPGDMKIRGNIHVLLVGDPGTGKCVAGETLVPLSNGELTPISTIVDHMLNQNQHAMADGMYAVMQQAVELPILNEDVRQIGGKAVAASKRKPEKMFKITTQSGKILKCTHTHPIFTSRNAKVKAVAAQELKIDDYVASPRKITLNTKPQMLIPVSKGKTNAVHITFPTQTSFEFGQWIGLQLGEGYSNGASGSTKFSFTNSDKENLALFEKLSKELFGLNQSINRSKETSDVYTLPSVELYRFIQANAPEMLHSSRERTIPKIIMKSDLQTVKGFLQTFMEGEAHVQALRKDGKHQSTIEVSSASKQLIIELSHLFLRFGIISTVKETMKMATNGARIKRPYWRLTIGSEFAQKYAREIGFITERKQKASQELYIENTNTNIDVIPHIGSELKRIRERVGLSQFEVNIARTTYQHYERGDRQPTRGKLYLIAQEFMDEYTRKGFTEVQLRHDIINLMKLSISDIFWDKITHMEEIPCDEYVYDIEVEGTHNFISNGIYSHNSILLQATDKIAPKSVYVSGKGSSSAGLCVAPDSLILNDNGFKSIEEFVETKFDNQLQREELPGAFSNEFSGQTHALTAGLDFSVQPVEKIWRIKAPSKMIQFTTRTGRELSLTPATSLIRLKNSKAEWIEANELQNGDYVAVPRFLPEGQRKNIPTFTVLLDDPYIKVGNPLAQWIKEIIEKLVPKYGTKQAIAKKVGKSRDTIYAIQNPKFHHGWELQKVVELAREAGYSDDQIAQKINTLFIRHGFTNRIPPYLDDPDVAYLVGAIMGDGSMEDSEDHTTIRLCGNDPQILERCTKILHDKFGIIPEKEKSTERVPSLRMSSRILGKILKAHGMRHEKKENTLSHMTTEMPNHVLRKLLQGLFDTDGYADDSKTGGKNVGISSISPELTKTIHLSLLKFGIISKKRFRRRAGNVAIGKKIAVISRNDQYCIEIYGKKNMELFREKIGFGLTRKQETLDIMINSIHEERTNIDFVPEIQEALQNTDAKNQYKKGKARISRAKLKELMKNEDESFLKKLSNANVLWDQIKTKKEFKPEYEYVYDMTVSGSHNFIANGFYVHNTASAVKDDFGEGGWTLKAGALVLASGGMVMVDEFDKMEPEDRSAMHEAMEQGMVSVAKAGMVTRFKTDTSVLAAANPKLSRFDKFKPFFEQIDLPPSLISRFDLFFMIHDTLNKERDEMIASHILSSHKVGEQMLQMQRAGKQGYTEEMRKMEEKVTPIIDIELLRKYIAYSRQRVFPILSMEATQLIQDFYVGLRDQGRQQGSYTATARQLEGLVRLAEASARVRLSDEVLREDAERAMRLVRASLEDVVKDPETGRIDIDIVTSGQTQSSRDHMRTITDIIKSKSKEMDKVPIQDVVAEALSRGIDEEKVRELITKLKKAGDIYEPSHGFLKAM